MRLIRKFLVCVGLSQMVWLTNAASQTPCPPTPTAAQVLAAATGRDHGFLWRIQKEGRVSFLYGTIHVARLEWATPGPRVLEALRASDVVALELDVTALPGPQSLLDATSPQSGEPAPSEALRERLRVAASRACVPPELLQTREPMLQLVATITLGARQDGLYPELGMDAMMAGLARAMKKRVEALETVSGQIVALRPPPGQQHEVLARELELIESGATRTRMLRMGEAWAEGDENAFTADPASDPELIERLLEGRNPGMAQGIAALHESGARVFAAVGALHLFGPRGLLELLHARGFSVERVPFGSEARH